MKTLKLIGYNVATDTYTNPATGNIENLPSLPIIQNELNVVGYEDYSDPNCVFIHNSKTFLDPFVDFSEWVNYQLTGFADINSFGDKEKIYWKNELGDLCIEETPIYTRTVEGTGLLAIYKLMRSLSIKYYKKDGTFLLVEMPVKHYSNKERIDVDKKSRNNIIERIREKTGQHIYTKNVIAGTPLLIEPELTSALTLFSTLSKQLQEYREDRNHEPLVLALTALVPGLPLTQDTIDFIKTGVNVTYY